MKYQSSDRTEEECHEGVNYTLGLLHGASTLIYTPNARQVKVSPELKLIGQIHKESLKHQ